MISEMAQADRAVCNCSFIVVCARSEELGLLEVGGFQKVPSSDCSCGRGNGSPAHTLKNSALVGWEPGGGGGAGAGGFCPGGDVF